MVDTGNNDARTEGMSYGMMMCVQMNRKDLFDKLWTFSMRYMHLSSGVHQGYFAWSVQLGGKSFTKFNRYLIGDILSVTPTEIGFLALVLLAVVSVMKRLSVKQKNAVHL